MTLHMTFTYRSQSLSRLQEVNFVYFIFLSHFYFASFDLLLIFLSSEQLGLGSEVIGHTVTSVTI